MKCLPTSIMALALIALSNCKEDDLSPLAKPELVSPADAATNADLNLTFNWNHVDAAQTYGFQLSRSPDFTETEKNSSEIEHVSITVDDLMADTKYYWRVNAKNALEISLWSDVWELTTRSVEIPILKTPEDNAIIHEMAATLEWNSVPDADTYGIHVSLSSDFSSTVLYKEGHATLSLNVTGLSGAVKYYWRVRASVNSCNSDWSTTWSFTPKRLIPTDGLVAYYPFNGNANDESGNLYNGSTFGATLSSDRRGYLNKAYSFDGVDDYISVAHNDALNLVGNFSISVWFKSDGCSIPCGTYHTVINKRDVRVGDDNWPWGVSVSYVSGGSEKEFRKIFASRRNGSNLDYQVSESEVQLNTWQHAVIIVKDNVQSIYVDGKSDGSYIYVQGQSASTKDMIIGWSLRPGLEQFKGLIDDIRLYSRALTLEEILALFEE